LPKQSAGLFDQPDAAQGSRPGRLANDNTGRRRVGSILRGATEVGLIHQTFLNVARLKKPPFFPPRWRSDEECLEAYVTYYVLPVEINEHMEHSLQTAHRHIWIKIPTALSSSVAVFDGRRLEYPRQERCVKYFNRNRHSSGCTAGEICPQLQAETHWKALLNKQEDSSHKKRAEVTVVHLPIDFGIKVHYSLSNANPHTHNHKAIINPCPSSIKKESSPLCKKKRNMQPIPSHLHDPTSTISGQT
jgi:hypothetical protein